MLDCGELDAAYGFEPRHDPKLQTFGNIDRYGGTPISGNPRLRKALFLPTQTAVRGCASCWRTAAAG